MWACITGITRNAIKVPHFERLQEVWIVYLGPLVVMFILDWASFYFLDPYSGAQSASSVRCLLVPTGICVRHSYGVRRESVCGQCLRKWSLKLQLADTDVPVDTSCVHKITAIHTADVPVNSKSRPVRTKTIISCCIKMTLVPLPANKQQSQTQNNCTLKEGEHEKYLTINACNLWFKTLKQ